jgi:hypothetical protein
MKLNRVTSNDPVERIALSMHKSVADTLRQYQAYYQATYGDEIPLSMLVEEVVKSFTSADKDFAKYQSQPKVPTAEGKPAKAEGLKPVAAGEPIAAGYLPTE